MFRLRQPLRQQRVTEITHYVLLDRLVTEGLGTCATDFKGPKAIVEHLPTCDEWVIEGT